MDTQEVVQQRIAHNVRVIARDKDVTLKSIADALEMSKASFYDRLRGKTALTITELGAIAEQLDVPVELLLNPKLPPWYAPRDSNPEPAERGSDALSAFEDGLVVAA